MDTRRPLTANDYESTPRLQASSDQQSQQDNRQSLNRDDDNENRPTTPRHEQLPFNQRGQDSREADEQDERRHTNEPAINGRGQNSRETDAEDERRRTNLPAINEQQDERGSGNEWSTSRDGGNARQRLANAGGYDVNRDFNVDNG